MPTYNTRIERAQEVMRSENVAALILAPSAQMRYLAGWAEAGHERLIAMLLPAVGEPAIIVPSLNAAQARTNAAGISDVRAWEDKNGWHAAAASLFSQWNLTGKTIAIDDELMAVHLLGIQSIIPGVACVPAADLMARLREIKSEEELSLLTRSANVTDSVYNECLHAAKKGMTELDLMEAVSQAYKKRGARVDFALICFGPNSALPHHHTGAAALRPGDVIVMDIGCTLDGYCSDITRTFAFGDPGEEARNIYRIVLKAHKAAYSVGMPGVACESVDLAARKVIEQAGYGDFFIHRTGHGIGMSGHEPPYIVQGNTQLLREGMCFSIEPGIYLPDRFGVRIENIETVTATGLRSLNDDPPEEMPSV